MIKLGVEEFTAVFGVMTERVASKIEDLDLRYEKLSNHDRDACLRLIVKALLGDELEVVGEHRHEKWEWGWGKNLEALQRGDSDALIPQYFKNDHIARWRRELVKPTKPGFDYGTLKIILEWLAEKYMKDASAVYEFGCGTGHHLPQIRDVNPSAKLIGLDWAETSQQIIGLMVEKGMIDNVEARRFDFFEPDESLVFEPDAVIYTTGALEQVGERHATFVDYLIRKRPRLCVHVEPISEVLDMDNLLDYLSVEYFRKRKYLWGFLTRLRELEAQEKVRIHDVRRSWCGGNIFVDHYSIVVWSPV